MSKPVAQADKLDRKASHRLNRRRDSGWMRAIGAASDIGDQPQLRLLCVGTMAVGAWRLDGKLLKTGLRMYVAHSLATWAKNRIKAVVDRTRPDSEADGYRAGIGDSDAHEETSFPSGHSAGVVAVAQAYSRAYPEHSAVTRMAAGAVAAAQVARGKHFIADVAAGALIGWAAERASALATRSAGRHPANTETAMLQAVRLGFQRPLT